MENNMVSINYSDASYLFFYQVSGTFVFPHNLKKFYFDVNKK